MLNFREKRSITGTNNVELCLVIYAHIHPHMQEDVYNDVENVDKWSELL